jgi:predicted ribosome quality control (RQC) complex YloA/Tae2 family protein
MHQNYYFLNQLATALRPQVLGLKCMECFSQEKDELMVVLAEARGKHNFYKPFYWRATLRPEFGCLSFPEDFSRAKNNSADLFAELTDLAVIGVCCFLNERAIGLVFEKGFTLVFKLFGNRSNAVLFKKNTVHGLFLNRLVADGNLELSSLNRTIDQSWAAYEAANHDHRKLFPTFGKVVNGYLEEQLKNIDLPQTKWQLIRATVQQLNNTTTLQLSTLNYQPTLSLVPVGDLIRTHSNPIVAINDFYANYQKINHLDFEKGEMLRLLQKKIQRTETYITETSRKVIEMTESTKNEELGHILMANLHQIPERIDRVELFDFYRNTTIVIKLKPDLSPQKNAENYYRKSKNERIEVDKMTENIGLREAEVLAMKTQFAEIEAAETLKELRKYLKVNSLTTNTIAATVEQLFKKIEFQDFVILIGKNAKNNDLLIKQYAHKEDLWLHARDVSGSHVLIKYRAGKKFPNTVIERAAQLAAWNSKRRNDSLCPVIVVPRKFVRKPKNAADGAVVLDKEEVIMVVPTA